MVRRLFTVLASRTSHLLTVGRFQACFACERVPCFRAGMSVFWRRHSRITVPHGGEGGSNLSPMDSAPNAGPAAKQVATIIFWLEG